MRAQHLAGPALIAAALLAAIPLAQVRTGTQSQDVAAAAQADLEASSASQAP